MNIAARAAGLSLLLLYPSTGEAGSPPSSARTNPPGCMPTDVTFPPDATGPAPAAVTVRFEVGEDGEARDVSVGFPIDAVVSDLLAESATRTVQRCKWVVGGDGSGDPDSRKVALRLPVVRAMTKDNRWTAPKKMGEESCFRDSFKLVLFNITKELKLTAKFPVFVDGKTGRARLLQRFDDPAIQERFEQSITDAVKACEWAPGSDEEGRPISMYVVLPITLR